MKTINESTKSKVDLKEATGELTSRATGMDVLRSGSLSLASNFNGLSSLKPTRLLNSSSVFLKSAQDQQETAGKIAPPTERVDVAALTLGLIDKTRRETLVKSKAKRPFKIERQFQPIEMKIENSAVQFTELKASKTPISKFFMEKR